MTAIDQHEEVGQLFAFQHVALDDLAELLASLFASLGIAISGQIDQIPFVIDQKMVDQHGFAWSLGGQCQPLLVRQHIDE